MKTKAVRERLYLGVDVGGTKIQASLVSESGAILGKQRQSTPRTGGPEQVLSMIETVIQEVLTQAKLETTDLTAIGVAVPGVVEPKSGHVVVTPNMSLTGVSIGAHLEGRFHVPVAIGNDGNLGTYGEAWLGSARKAQSALGIWVGTGIGAGLVTKGRMWRGARESAGEIGHIIMQIGGPVCGCGNHGCLEALASRTAIERDIRAALQAGGTSKLTELSGGDLSVIRSGAIRKALKAEDPLVTGILHRAAETLGYACLTVRHLVDPEVIVLGGGLIEACSEFMMPILENIVGSDRLPGRPRRRPRLALGPGRRRRGPGRGGPGPQAGRPQPLQEALSRRADLSRDRPLQFRRDRGRQEGLRSRHLYPVSGKVKARDKDLAKREDASVQTIGPKSIGSCKVGPEVLLSVARSRSEVASPSRPSGICSQRSIRCEILPAVQLVDVYNKSKARKAALIHVTG